MLSPFPFCHLSLCLSLPLSRGSPGLFLWCFWWLEPCPRVRTGFSLHLPACLLRTRFWVWGYRTPGFLPERPGTL